MDLDLSSDCDHIVTTLGGGFLNEYAGKACN
jgi:hypothetical protein